MTYIIYMCVLGLVDDLEARVVKSSPQTIAPGNTPRRRCVPRKTGDGACEDIGGGAVGAERIGSDRKPKAFLCFKTRRSSRKDIKL